jgi:hydrogenase maturation protease
MTRVRVIGCGNIDAGDDALGLLAVRRVRPLLPESVEVVEAGSGAHVVDLLQNVDGVVVVDAILAGVESNGATIRVDVRIGEVPVEVRTSLSSHGLGLPEAMMLAAAVGLPLPKIVILGLVARNTEIGSGLSPEVAAQLGALVQAIVHEVSVLKGVLVS